MSSLILTNTATLTGSAWTGTAPGPGNPTVSGTITSTTDWSDHLAQVTIDDSLDMQDFTTFGDGAFKSQKPGLLGSDLQLDFNQDFAASSVDSVFFAAQLARTLLYFDIKPTSSARGATNPSFVIAGYVSKYTPLGTKVGDRAAAPVGIAVTGTFARLTS